MNPVQGTNLSQLEAPQQKQNPSSGITVLPRELQQEIFKRLLPEDLSRMAHTSRTFREISKTTLEEKEKQFVKQKQQVQTFLKRILSSEVFSEEIEQDITNSKNFEELNRVIEQEIIPLEDPDKQTCLLAEAIKEHTKLGDLPTIQFLHEVLECSPIFLLSKSFCSKLSLETVDKLVDLLIEKYGIKFTYQLCQSEYGPDSGLFPHSRKLHLYPSEVSANHLRQASDRLKDDKRFMLAIIKKCVPRTLTSSPYVPFGYFLHYSPPRTDTSTTNDYWPQSGNSVCEVLEAASEGLKDDIDVVLAAAQRDGFALSLASERLRNNKDIVLAALQSKIRPKDMSEFVPEALRNDPDIQIWLSSDRLLDDREFMLNIIENCEPWANSSATLVYRALEDASDRLKDDKGLVLAAVRSNAFALRLASESLRNDKEIVLAALQSWSRPRDMSEFVPDALREDPDIQIWLRSLA